MSIMDRGLSTKCGYWTYTHEEASAEEGDGGVNEGLVPVLSGLLKSTDGLSIDLYKTDVDHDTS